MKIFVTGSTGFIGRNAVKVLAERDHNLMLLVRSEEDNSEVSYYSNDADFVVGDLSDIERWKDSLNNFGPEVVLHLAWEGLPDYSQQICRRNFKYGVDLFTAAAEAGCKSLVCTGSCWEYKNRIGMLNEDAEVETGETFAAIKNSLRLTGKAISSEVGMDLYWIRLFYVYGPRQKESSLIPHVIRSLLAGEIPLVKNPDNRNDFVYVCDVAEGIADIVEKQPGGSIYNIGSGYSSSVADIIAQVYKAITAVTNRVSMQLPEITDHGKGDDFWADISRMGKDAGWSPKHSLEDGIRETVNYYAELNKRTEAV